MIKMNAHVTYFLFIKFEIEEKMLLSEFGQEYEEYKKRTKKLLPYSF